MDSTCLMFLFVCKIDSNTPDEKFRDIVFDVIVKTDLEDRFDTSHPFWDNLGVRDKTLKKKLGYYRIEHIDNPCQIVLAIYPKEYSDYFKNEKSDKKHKDVKKGSPGMEFEDFVHRLHLLNEIKNFRKQTIEKQD